MENATKALIIAGSVLIAIVLIAIGVYYVSSTSSTRDEVDFQMSELEISMFNSQFTKYEGKQRGSKIKELLRLVQRSNSRGDKGTISIYNGETQVTTDGMDTFINTTIQSNIQYQVKIEIDITSGLVNKITITTT